jgi:hypothetical protein
MTSIPDFNYPLFHKTAKALRDAGYKVFNPAENHNGNTDLPLEEYFKADLPQVIKADAIAVLPDWQNSAGATIEVTLARHLGKQVIDALTGAEIVSGDKRFHKLLKEIGQTHDQKQRDYGTNEDPFANVRGSSDWGIKPWIGAMVRANDKVKRIQKFAREGNLANESVRDSFVDLSVYSLIALILWEEENG